VTWAECVGQMPYHRLGRQTEQQKNIKIRHGLKRLPIYASNTTTNQKHSGMMKERKARRFNRVGAWGKHDSIVLGAIELGGDKKLK
jgi:hypothetical protein